MSGKGGKNANLKGAAAAAPPVTPSPSAGSQSPSSSSSSSSLAAPKPAPEELKPILVDEIPAWAKSVKFTRVERTQESNDTVNAFWAARNVSIRKNMPEPGKKRKGPSPDDGIGKMIPEVQNIFLSEIFSDPTRMARDFSNFKVSVAESGILKSRVILLFIYGVAGPENLRALLRTKADQLDSLTYVEYGELDDDLWSELKIKFSTIPRRKAFCIMPEATLLQNTVWAPTLALCAMGKKDYAVAEMPSFTPEKYRGKIVEDICNYIRPMLGFIRSLLSATNVLNDLGEHSVIQAFAPSTTLFAKIGEELKAFHTRVYEISFQRFIPAPGARAVAPPEGISTPGAVIVPE